MQSDIVWQLLGYFLIVGSAVYILLSLLAVLRHARPKLVQASSRGVTVLKPLYGDEPRLYENLRSFFEQDHPDYQLLFGLRDADDAALAVVRRLQAEFPQRDAGVVIDARVHGVNLKVSNLINLLPQARHGWLVLADSDIFVAPDYLRAVTAPLAQADVGLVTCLYRGRPLGGLWSRVGTQFIDDWFRPSVRLAQLFGATRYGFGATLALRRETLAAIGGFETVADLVADDHCLGERIADHGLRTVLSDHEIVTDVVETRLADLVAHELRWFRTIRSVRPASYLGTGVCFTLPVALGGLALTGFAPIAAVLAITAISARTLLFIHGQTRRTRTAGLAQNFAAFLLRDSLSLLLWTWAFGSGRIRWRDREMTIDSRAVARASQ